MGAGRRLALPRARRAPRPRARRERADRRNPVRRRGPPPGIRAGAGRTRHLRGQLPGADDPLAGGRPGRLGGGVPRRRPALPDGPPRRRSRAPDHGRESRLRALPGLFARRRLHRLRLLGRHRGPPAQGSRGGRRADPSHGNPVRIHPPGLDPGRERHRGGARHRRPGAGPVLVPEPPLRPGAGPADGGEATLIARTLRPFNAGRPLMPRRQIVAPSFGPRGGCSFPSRRVGSGTAAARM